MVVSPNITACEQLLDILVPATSRPYIQSPQTIEQLRQLWEIDKRAYGDCSLDFEKFADWWRLYPYGVRCLMAEEQIMAAVGVYPLSKEQWTAFSEGQISEALLLPVSLEECEATPQKHWYASGVVVIEALRGKSNSPLRTLIQFALSSWISSTHVAYPLNLIAITEYPIGAKILKYLDFVKAADGSKLPDGCDLYKSVFASQRQALEFLKRKGF
jgi:hypothetical protein